MRITKSKINKFLLFKLPSAYFCGVRLKEINDYESVVTVKHRWINQNPFRSMYFAVQSMAAELTTGVLLIKQIQESGKKVSMLVTSHTGSFSKKAVGRITFKCTEGKKINEALKKALETGEGQTVVMNAVGVDEQGDVVSTYQFEWGIKVK